MGNKNHLSKILQSTSDVLFPAELGEKNVEIDSAGCDGDTPLHVMVWRKDRAAVDLLIKNGANVNAIGDMSQTPLHVAISQKDEYIVRSLLNAGARIDIRSEFNETALEKALKVGGKIEELLTKHLT